MELISIITPYYKKKVWIICLEYKNYLFENYEPTK